MCSYINKIQFNSIFNCFLLFFPWQWFQSIFNWMLFLHFIYAQAHLHISIVCWRTRFERCLKSYSVSTHIFRLNFLLWLENGIAWKWFRNWQFLVLNEHGIVAHLLWHSIQIWSKILCSTQLNGVHLFALIRWHS